MNGTRKATLDLFQLFASELDPNGDVGMSPGGGMEDFLSTIVIALKAVLHDRECLRREKKELGAENDELLVIIEKLEQDIEGLHLQIEALEASIRHLVRKRKNGRGSKNKQDK